MLIILEGPAGNGIGKGIAKELGVKCLDIEHRLFPDYESYIRIPKMPKDDTVVVVQSTYAPQEKHLMELLFIIDTLKEIGIKNIIAVIPYLAYVRQNKSFSNQESISINTVIRLLNDSGVKALITVEPHKKEALSHFKGKIGIIDSSSAFADVLSKSVPNPFIIATDKGDIERAKSLSKLLKCGLDYIEKERKTSYEVRAVSTIKSDLKGKDVIVFDDMISTGGTVELAAKIAHSKGAKKVIAAASHLLMVGEAREKLKRAGVSEIYGLNTVPYDAKVIDISKDIAEEVKRLI